MMMHFLKNLRGSGNPGLDQERSAQATLGPLEISIMDVLWTRGESSVRDVAEKLERPLAYTTVMTTLDRLYKKNCLDRRKSERAFRYSPKFSRVEWERNRAGQLVAGFLEAPRRAPGLLISCLVDAVDEYNPKLLEELEKQIRARRREIRRRRRS